MSEQRKADHFNIENLFLKNWFIYNDYYMICITFIIFKCLPSQSSVKWDSNLHQSCYLKLPVQLLGLPKCTAVIFCLRLGLGLWITNNNPSQHFYLQTSSTSTLNLYEGTQKHQNYLLKGGPFVVHGYTWIPTTLILQLPLLDEGSRNPPVSVYT